VPRQRRAETSSKTRTRWATIGALVALLVLDVVLVALALQSTSSTAGATSGPAPVPTSTDSARPTPTPQPSGSPASPSGAPSAPDGELTATVPSRILAALDESIAWRATTGACPDALAAPELTVDRGNGWKATDVSGTTGVRSLQRIFVSDGETASFIGAGAGDCSPQFVRTFVAGDDFDVFPDQLAGSWYLAPVGGAVVHTPTGEAAAPCPAAVSIAPLDENRAAVLCDDSAIHLTVDAGATWDELSETPGAIALTATRDGLVVVVAGDDDCAGAVILGVDIGRDVVDTRTDVACVESPASPRVLAATTAIDWTDAAMWLWIDDRVLISVDGGQSWT
jgi:hypothetical protein